MPPDLARVDSAVEEAIARGDFDDLPGAGMPLRLPDHHDPDWWITKRLEDGDIDRDALLPVVVLLRRERERLEETLVELRDEQSVREYVQDFNARVRTDRAQQPVARLIAPEVEVEHAVSRWRDLRSASADPGPSAPAAPQLRRRWWQRRRHA